jgi:hypothetical protein
MNSLKFADRPKIFAGPTQQVKREDGGYTIATHFSAGVLDAQHAAFMAIHLMDTAEAYITKGETHER